MARYVLKTGVTRHKWPPLRHPMPHVTKAVTVLGLALVAWGLFVVVGQSSANQAMLRTIADQKAENAAIVESAYREKRADSLKYTRMVAEALRSVRVAEGRSRSALAATAHTIDSLRLASRDTEHDSVTGAAPSDSVPRSAFTDALAQYDSLATAFRAYLMSDSTYHRVIEAERASVYSLLTLADSTITVKNQALQALRNVGECRIIGPIRCPTRTQSAVGGALITLGVFMAVR